MAIVTKKQLLKAIQDLTDFVKGETFTQLKKDSEELHRIQGLLANVKFKIKDISYFKEDNAVRIVYELPKIVLPLDENGKVAKKDDFFYSSNVLELISLEDMLMIQEFLNNLSNKIQNERKE